jgi:hypothetical protein
MAHHPLHLKPHDPKLHGILAEFDKPQDLLAAARKAWAAGYRRMEAYTPLPIEGLSEAIGFHHSRLPLLVLLGGLFGCGGGLLLQWWTSAVEYPLNIGGKPFASWPAFIPVTFETTILCASLTAVFGMLILNGLPMPYHAVFNVKSFALASRDKFFLCIEAEDAKFHRDETRRFLADLHPKEVLDVLP